MEDNTNSLVDLTAPSYDDATNKITFITRRALDTGDSGQDFLVPIGKELPMSYGFVSGSAAWRQHDDKGVWTIKVLADGIVVEGDLDITDLLRVDEFEQHGWWMWSAWYIVGLLLLVTKRYAKKTWTLSHYLHAVLGYFILIVTIVWAFKVL